MSKSKDKKSMNRKSKDKMKPKNAPFPVRIPMPLIRLMDAFLKAHEELGMISRQELARRCISDWLLNKERELAIPVPHSKAK